MSPFVEGLIVFGQGFVGALLGAWIANRYCGWREQRPEKT